MLRFFIALIGFYILAHSVLAQITLNGSVVDEGNKPVTATITLTDSRTINTKPDGTFSVKISDWEELDGITAYKENYKFLRSENNRNNGSVTIYMSRNTFEVSGMIINSAGGAVQGASVELPDFPSVKPVYSNPKGIFKLTIPSGTKLTRGSNFKVDGNSIAKKDIAIKDNRIRLTIAGNESPYPVYQVRVIDADERPVADVILNVAGRVYESDDAGLIQMIVYHNVDKDSEVESSKWKIIDRKYDGIPDALILTVESLESTAKKSVVPQDTQDELEDEVGISASLDAVTKDLEKEEVELSERRQKLIKEIEGLTQELASSSDNLTDQERTKLADQLYNLERILAQVDNSYADNRQKTDSLMRMMKDLIIVQKKQIEETSAENKGIKKELFNEIEEKIEKEADFNKKLTIAAGLIAFILIVAIVVFIFMTRLRQQKKQLEVLHNSLSESTRKLTDNMRYAKDIQDTIHPAEQAMSAAFSDHFVLFRSRDLVSGDFYWLSTEVAPYRFVAVVDCTGHGVSGAFMAMIGNTLLNEIVNQKQTVEPAQILDELNTRVRVVLKQDQEANDDGMDLCLCRLEEKEGGKVELVYAGAKRSLYAYQNGKIEVIRGSSRSIGGRQRSKSGYKQTAQLLEKGDRLYLTSDGFTDQNNKQRRKLGTQKFIEQLEFHATQPLSEQKTQLEIFLKAHQGSEQQRDDITVLGIEV
ncbi:MAG: SpoIIE family protein phosphatase [Bacteroidota bacterium]